MDVRCKTGCFNSNSISFNYSGSQNLYIAYCNSGHEFGATAAQDYMMQVMRNGREAKLAFCESGDGKGT